MDWAFFPTRISQAYDAMIFIDKTTASVLLR
jgi:hypothetical protein